MALPPATTNTDLLSGLDSSGVPRIARFSHYTVGGTIQDKLYIANGGKDYVTVTDGTVQGGTAGRETGGTRFLSPITPPGGEPGSCFASGTASPLVAERYLAPPVLNLDEGVNWTAVAGAPSAALKGVGAGNLSAGTYRWRVTFVNAAGDETEGGTISAAVTVADPSVNGQVALTNIPTGGTGTVARKVYRTNHTGSGYALSFTISDNTTTTADDNNADASLTTTCTLGQWTSSDLTHGVPSRVSSPVYGGNGLYALGWKLTAHYDATLKGDLELEDTFDSAADLDGEAVTTWNGSGSAPTWATGLLAGSAVGKWVKAGGLATYSQTSDGDTLAYAVVDHGLQDFVLEFRCAALSTSQFKECRAIFLWESASNFWYVRSNKGSHSSYPYRRNGAQVMHEIAHMVNGTVAQSYTVGGAIEDDQIVTIRVKGDQADYYLGLEHALSFKVDMAARAAATKVGLFACLHRGTKYRNNAASYDDFCVYHVGEDNSGGAQGVTLTSPLYDGVSRHKLFLGTTNDTGSLVFFVNSDRAGAFMKVTLEDSTGAGLTEDLIDITKQGQWQRVEINLSGLSAATRESIQRIVFECVDDSAGAQVYFDSVYAPGCIEGDVSYVAAYWNAVTGQLSPASLIAETTSGKIVSLNRTRGARDVARSLLMSQSSGFTSADKTSLSKRVRLAFTAPTSRPDVTPTLKENTPTHLLIYRHDGINPDQTRLQWQLAYVCTYFPGSGLRLTGGTALIYDNKRFADLPEVPTLKDHLPNFLMTLIQSPVHPPKAVAILAWRDRMIYGGGSYQEWIWKTDGTGNWRTLADTAAVFVSMADFPGVCTLETTPLDLARGGWWYRVSDRHKPVLEIVDWDSQPVIGTQGALYLHLGQTAENWVTEAFTHRGLAGPGGLVCAEHALIHYDGTTVWRYTGGPRAVRTEEVGKALRGYWQGLAAATKRRLVSAFDPISKCAYLGDPVTGVLKAFDTENGQWHTRTQTYAAFWWMTDRYTEDGTRYYADSRTGPTNGTVSDSGSCIRKLISTLSRDEYDVGSGTPGTWSTHATQARAHTKAKDFGDPWLQKVALEYLLRGSQDTPRPEVAIYLDLCDDGDAKDRVKSLPPFRLDDDAAPTYCRQACPSGTTARILQERLSVTPATNPFRLYQMGYPAGKLTLGGKG